MYYVGLYTFRSEKIQYRCRYLENCSIFKWCNTDTLKTKCFYRVQKSIKSFRNKIQSNCSDFGPFVLLFKVHNVQDGVIKQKQNIDLIKNSFSFRSTFLKDIVKSIFICHFDTDTSLWSQCDLISLIWYTALQISPDEFPSDNRVT